MEFTCEKDVLAGVVAAAFRGASSKTGYGDGAGLRLLLEGDTLTAIGAGGDIHIAATAEVNGSSDGDLAMPPRLLSDVTRSLAAGAVECVERSGVLRVTAGASEFSIQSLATVPPQVQTVAGDLVKVDAETFVIAASQVSIAASSDDARPILTAVLMETVEGHLRMVATDSYRLCRRDIEDITAFDAEQKALVPARALKELAHFASEDDEEIGVVLGAQSAAFIVGDVTITSRLIEGDTGPRRVVVRRRQIRFRCPRRDRLRWLHVRNAHSSAVAA